MNTNTSIDSASITNFTNLVRLGIGHQAESLIEPVDWNAIEALAERQGTLGIMYDAVQELKGSRSSSQENFPPLTTWLRWMGMVIQGYEQWYVLYRKAEAGLGAWYREHGFRMMVLKGLACGLDWPRPEHRPYGDIDICLFGKQSEADALMVQEFKVDLSVEPAHTRDNSSKLGSPLAQSQPSRFDIDKSHHHHTVFNWGDFMVENHYDFVNVHVHESSRELESIFKRLANKDDCLPLTA